MVLEKGTELELGKVPLQGPRQDTPDLQGAGRPLLGVGLCLWVLTFSHVHTTALSRHWEQASRGHSRQPPGIRGCTGLSLCLGTVDFVIKLAARSSTRRCLFLWNSHPHTHPRGVTWRRPHSQDGCAE